MEILLGVVLALITAAGALYLARSQRDSNVGATALALSEAASALVVPLRSELSATHDRLVRIEGELERLDAANRACMEREQVLLATVAAIQAALGGRRAEDGAVPTIDQVKAWAAELERKAHKPEA